jgi:hypothetical protein
VCYSKAERERWEQLLAREADEERARSIDLEPQPKIEPETEPEEEREGELIRI